MQGTVYVFPTRAMPLLTTEEDLNIKLDSNQASWFGKINIIVLFAQTPYFLQYNIVHFSSSKSFQKLI